MADQRAKRTPMLSASVPIDVEVAIVGGGPGGLAACIALRARGINAHIFEGESSLLRGSTGTGIMISANGFRALEAIDPALPDMMRAFGARITSQSIRLTKPTGEEISAFSSNASRFLDAYGAEQYNIGWARAHELLASMVPSDVVHCGYRLKSYALSPEGDKVDVIFENGLSVSASLLVGADGAGSRVRRLVANDAACKTQYNGQLLWNAILPTKDVPHVHGPGEVEFVRCGPDGQVILAFDAGEGQTSWYLTMMEEHAPPKVAAALKSGSFGGFGRADVIEDLKEVFAPWPVALECLQATPESQIFERRIADRPRLMQWADTSSRGGGRVVLMGDAAHPMVPSQGQGTMVTFEDAADLAACIARSKQNDASEALPAAVKAFVDRRAKRCAMVQRVSAKTYMGRPVPKLFPLKLLRLTWMRSSLNKILGGYTPLS